MEPTVFHLPRRRIAIGAYTPAPVTDLLLTRDAGHIMGAELTFERTIDEFRAPDLSSGACRNFVAYANWQSGTGTLSIEMMSADAKNLALMFESALTPAAAGAQTDTMPTMTNGDCVNTKLIPDLTQTFEIQDSDASPATLVEGTHWEFYSRNAGGVRILDIASFVQPFKVNYTSVAAQQIDPMSKQDEYYYIVLSGANESAGCKGDKDEFWKCRISEEQVQRLHEPSDTNLPVPTTVVFTIDRDETRDFSFARLSRRDVA